VPTAISGKPLTGRIVSTASVWVAPFAAANMES
jgi:hypothetical protein